MVSIWFFSLVEWLLVGNRRLMVVLVITGLLILALLAVPQFTLYACESGTGSCPCPGC